MAGMFTKDKLVEALKWSSSTLPNSEEQQHALKYLQNAAQRTGFTMVMVDITYDPTLSFEVRKEALSRVCDAIRNQRYSRKQPKLQMQLAQQAIISSIPLWDSQMWDAYINILGMIGWFKDSDRTHPEMLIIEFLQRSESVERNLRALTVVLSSLRFETQLLESNSFKKFFRRLVEVVSDLLRNNLFGLYSCLCFELIYVLMDIRVPDDVLLMLRKWIPFVSEALTGHSPDCDAHLQLGSKQGTEEYYYFRTKKFAANIVTTVLSEYTQTWSWRRKPKFAVYWNSNWCEHFLKCLANELRYPTTKEVRIWQIYCLSYFMRDKQQLGRKYLSPEDQNLLSCIRLTLQDRTIVQSNPVLFMENNSIQVIDENHIRPQSALLWLSIWIKQQNDEPSFLGLYRYLFQMLQSSLSLSDREVYMYLLSAIELRNQEFPIVFELINQIIESVVIHELQSQHLTLRAEAINICSQYFRILNPKIGEKIAIQITKSLINDPEALVRLTAAVSLPTILKERKEHLTVYPFVSDLFSSYVELSKTYEWEKIIDALEKIVEFYSREAIPYTGEMLKLLPRLLKSKKSNYYSEYICCSINEMFKRIMANQLTSKQLDQIQTCIIQLLQFICFEKQIQYALKDVLEIICRFLSQKSQITNNFHVYFELLIYYNNNLTNNEWQFIKTLDTDKKVSTIQKYMKAQSIRLSWKDEYTGIFGLYLSKSKGNNLRQAFTIYMKILNKSLQNDKYFPSCQCCSVLCYMLQTNKQEIDDYIFTECYKYSRDTIEATRYQKYDRYDNDQQSLPQLMGLLLWHDSQKFIKMMEKDELIVTFMKALTINQHNYRRQHQRARVLLGINSLLNAPDLEQQPQQLLERLPELFVAAVKIAKKDAKKKPGNNPNQNQVMSERSEHEGEESANQNEENEDYDSDERNEQTDKSLSYVSQDQLEQIQDNCINMSWKLLHESIDAVSMFGATLSRLMKDQSDFAGFVKSLVTERKLSETMERINRRNHRPQVIYD